MYTTVVIMAIWKAAKCFFQGDQFLRRRGHGQPPLHQAAHEYAQRVARVILLKVDEVLVLVDQTLLVRPLGISRPRVVIPLLLSSLLLLLVLVIRRLEIPLALLSLLARPLVPIPLLLLGRRFSLDGLVGADKSRSVDGWSVGVGES